MNRAVKISPEERAEIRQKTAKPLLKLALIAIVMLFAGLTSAYVVSKASRVWLDIELPLMFWISSAIIITSSGTMVWALQSARKNNPANIKTALMLTFFLGIAFCISQYMGWADLYSRHIVFAGRESNAAGSYIYFLTALHVVHLFAGMIALTVCWVNSIRGKYNSENTLGLELCSLYWHFLDFLWIYLFLFLYFMR